MLSEQLMIIRNKCSNGYLNKYSIYVISILHCLRTECSHNTTPFAYVYKKLKPTTASSSRCNHDIVASEIS